MLPDDLSESDPWRKIFRNCPDYKCNAILALLYFISIAIIL